MQIKNIVSVKRLLDDREHLLNIKKDLDDKNCVKSINGQYISDKYSKPFFEVIYSFIVEEVKAIERELEEL